MSSEVVFSLFSICLRSLLSLINKYKDVKTPKIPPKIKNKINQSEKGMYGVL